MAFSGGLLRVDSILHESVESQQSLDCSRGRLTFPVGQGLSLFSERWTVTDSGSDRELANTTEGGVKRFWFELGPIRPPSEGRDHSLLIRATRNCPWNRCHFCNVYKGQKFQYRSVAEIKEDIDAARVVAEELKSASWRLGLGGMIDRTVLNAVMNGSTSLYSSHSPDPGRLDVQINCLVNVANWLASGGRTAFLQDADTLIMRLSLIHI